VSASLVRLGTNLAPMISIALIRGERVQERRQPVGNAIALRSIALRTLLLDSTQPSCTHCPKSMARIRS
jgi:hypothetical protein